MKLKDFTITPADENCGLDSVSWENIKSVMDSDMLRNFQEWMMGQTQGMNGVYVDDLARFLRGVPDFRF